MRIEVVPYHVHRDYVRNARAEILGVSAEHLTDRRITPVSFAKYLFAYSDSESTPIGFAESAMHHDVYDSYEATPYGPFCDLSDFCPIEQMAGIRTIFVEPEHRRGSPAFLALCYHSAMYFSGMGATYTTATTRADDAYVNAFYCKIGGKCFGTGEYDGIESSLFVFKLHDLVGNRFLARAARAFAFEPDPAFALA